MKKRKIVSLVLATVLGASMVLGGCGSKGESSASNTEGTRAERVKERLQSSSRKQRFTIS